jgi:dihydrofolate synthase/folylpolyglutamate synthase
MGRPFEGSLVGAAIGFPCPSSPLELFSLHPLELVSMRPSLGRLEAVLHALGDPHAGFPSILVAGTNGKGSTSTFLAAGLIASGLKTGLFTSPHLLNPLERILIQGRPLPEERLDAAFYRILRAVLELQLPLTFFEWLSALMFVAFQESGVDVGVLEVGMGGRLDATNLAKRRIATVITSIGRDHTGFLGESLDQILVEKAGIARPEAPLFAHLPQRGLQSRLEGFAEARGVRIVFLGRQVRYRLLEATLFSTRFVFEGRSLKAEIVLGMLGEHQAANASLALAVLEHLANEGSLGVRMPGAVGALKSAFLPARMQLLGQAPLILLDGAHNVHGAIALVSFLGPRLEGLHPACIVGMSKGKDVSAMLKCLYRLKPEFVFPEVAHDRLLSAQAIAREAKALGMSFRVAPTIYDAAKLFNGQQPILFTGSLYFAGEVLKALGKGEP